MNAHNVTGEKHLYGFQLRQIWCSIIEILNHALSRFKAGQQRGARGVWKKIKSR